jgi:Aminomethyltransferase folate-binding domain
MRERSPFLKVRDNGNRLACSPISQSFSCLSTQPMTELDSASLFRTLLYPLHLELNARMVPFSGWEMPVQYSSIGKEHQAVRQQAGMFDISHMGKFVLGWG